ncbi:MAG TPA: MotA/TolQ/ExbB proton channel family protein [Kiritimatiellia bacterium]|nr:MotA/TolQ/ExbB proton channel family protein [Kiritimatiellia bacterium]
MPSILIFAPLPLANLSYAFQSANFFSGKMIVIILMVMSVVAWTIMIAKVIEQRRMRFSANRFLDQYRRQDYPLDLYLARRSRGSDPVTVVYNAACSALGLELEHRKEGGLTDDEIRPTLTALQVGAVRNAAEREIAEQNLTLEKFMGFLAIAVSASPMLGLLGTVWGVLESFSAMGLHGAANLTEVAPGIASALMTTVVGLFVALPSAIGYNILAGGIKKMTVDMDNFADEFASSIQRSYLRE